MRRQTAAIAHEMDARQGYDRCQLFQEFQRREFDAGRTVRPRSVGAPPTKGAHDEATHHAFRRSRHRRVDDARGAGYRAADTVTTRLSGYQETPLTINAPASGEFKATMRDDGTAIDYTLTYRDLSSPVTQAHIHFGRPAISGGIVLFLCTNLTPPAGVPTPQMCPPAPATITGMLTAADVIAVAA